jgi:hypothetical protein
MAGHNEELFFMPTGMSAMLVVTVMKWLCRAFAALALLMGWAISSGAWAAGDEPLDLKFASFFQLPIGPRGLEIGDALRAADGRRVRLVGHMVAQEEPEPGRFLLTPRPVRMSEHADGQADDLPPATVTVLLHPSQHDRVVAHQPGLVSLTGRLAVGREEEASGRVSWVRLQLDPEALADSHLAATPNATAGTP